MQTNRYFYSAKRLIYSTNRLGFLVFGACFGIGKDIQIVQKYFFQEASTLKKIKFIWHFFTIACKASRLNIETE